MEDTEEKESRENLERLEKEILYELNSPDYYGLEEPPKRGVVEGEENASRKPFRINDFDTPHDREMAVFTHAKKLSEYVFVITEKSPKKFRWSIISRLQNASVEVIENLYHANFEREVEARLNYQKRAAVSLKLLDFYAETARKKQAITIRQTGVLAQYIAETGKLLNGWIKSTRRK
ncbi:MAG: four helix bundle protein [Clostridia bacterium]|nr:four helix bundle protein [Clostridia bacterium]